MYVTALIAVLAGLGMSYVAIRMMRNRDFTVWLNTARWNPQGRMYVRMFGLGPMVRFNRNVLAPVLLVVSVGLWLVAVWLVAGRGK